MSLNVDLYADQYATFSTEIDLTDQNGNALNLTNYTIVAAVRDYYNSQTLTTFTTNVVNASNGNIVIALDANTTANLYTQSFYGRNLYDVITIDTNNVVTRVVEGIFTIRPGVSVPAFVNTTPVADAANNYWGDLNLLPTSNNYAY